MIFDLFRMWVTMTTLSNIVAVALVLLGLAALGVTIERLLALALSASRSAAFARASRPLLAVLDEDHGADEVEEALEALEQLAAGKRFARAPLAGLTRTAILVWRRGSVELARRELARELDELDGKARRGLGFVGSLGSIALLIGMLGTVLDIIVAFQAIAASDGGIKAIAAGIASALVVTALGLGVAIAAIVMFGQLSGRFNRRDMALEHAVGRLLDRLERLERLERARAAADAPHDAGDGP